MSGGVRVLVDQAAQDGFSADPFSAGVSCGDAGSVAFAVGDALRDALVRPSRVVAGLVLGQGGAQMRRAGISMRSRSSRRRVPTRRSQVAFMRGALDGCAQDPGAGGLEYRVEGAGEVRSRSRMRNLMSSNRWSRARARLRLAARSRAGGMCGDAAEVHTVGLEYTIGLVTCVFG